MLHNILERVVQEEANKLFDSWDYEVEMFNIEKQGVLLLYIYLWATDDLTESYSIEQKFPYECVREMNFRKHIRDVLQYRKRELEEIYEEEIAKNEQNERLYCMDCG